jgi:hypothetical protein
MTLTEQSLDNFYQTIETEKSNVLNKMKEKNIDKKELRKLNNLLTSYNSLQANILKLRQLIRPELE